jgi:hypothetical protein
MSCKQLRELPVAGMLGVACAHSTGAKWLLFNLHDLRHNSGVTMLQVYDDVEEEFTKDT